MIWLALKLPEASLKTRVEAVLFAVAFEVTVKVTAPELLYVAEPDRPLPEVPSVRVLDNEPLSDVAVIVPTTWSFEVGLLVPMPILPPYTPSEMVPFAFTSMLGRPETSLTENILPDARLSVILKSCPELPSKLNVPVVPSRTFREMGSLPCPVNTIEGCVVNPLLGVIKIFLSESAINPYWMDTMYIVSLNSDSEASSCGGKISSNLGSTQSPTVDVDGGYPSGKHWSR